MLGALGLLLLTPTRADAEGLYTSVGFRDTHFPHTLNMAGSGVGIDIDPTLHRIVEVGWSSDSEFGIDAGAVLRAILEAEDPEEFVDSLYSSIQLPGFSSRFEYGRIRTHLYNPAVPRYGPDADSDLVIGEYLFATANKDFDEGAFIGLFYSNVRAPGSVTLKGYRPTSQYSRLFTGGGAGYQDTGAAAVDTGWTDHLVGFQVGFSCFRAFLADDPCLFGGTTRELGPVRLGADMGPNVGFGLTIGQPSDDFEAEVADSAERVAAGGDWTVEMSRSVRGAVYIDWSMAMLVAVDAPDTTYGAALGFQYRTWGGPQLSRDPDVPETGSDIIAAKGGGMPVALFGPYIQVTRGF